MRDVHARVGTAAAAAAAETFASANDLANAATPGAPAFEGAAPSVLARYATAYDEAAWRLLALRHPRRFRKAMCEVEWLLSHHQHYLKRVL